MTTIISPNPEEKNATHNSSRECIPTSLTPEPAPRESLSLPGTDIEELIQRCKLSDGPSSPDHSPPPPPSSPNKDLAQVIDRNDLPSIRITAPEPAPTPAPGYREDMEYATPWSLSPPPAPANSPVTSIGSYSLGMYEAGEEELRDEYLFFLPEPVTPGTGTPVEGEAVEEGMYGNAACAMRSWCCGGGSGRASSS